MGITGTFTGYVTNPLYLYNSGTWTAMSPTGLTFGYSDYFTRISFKENSTYIRFTIPYKQDWGGFIRTNATFNFANYNYLNFNFGSIANWQDRFFIGVSSDATPSNTDLNNGVYWVNFSAYTTAAEGNRTVNISNVRNRCYIWFLLSQTWASSDLSGSFVIDLRKMWVSN